MSYDPKCEELARYFLGPGTTEEDVKALAEMIQQTIEDHLFSFFTTDRPVRVLGPEGLTEKDFE